MSPVAHFNFVSKLYTGSISDKRVVRRCRFLDELQPGDAVMADKVFNIQDLLPLHDTRPIAPSIMKKDNVSAAAATLTRRIARVRVHIEQMIRKLKSFNILKGAMPLTMKPYVNAVVTVCAALVNLQPSCIAPYDDVRVLKGYINNSNLPMKGLCSKRQICLYIVKIASRTFAAC
jgi:hypothetical protein